MCGRFTLRTNPQQLALKFAAEMPADLAPRYNVAPTQDVAAVRTAKDGSRQFCWLRWGLIPSWAKDATIGNRMINARAEGIATKPAFRTALRRRRCLVLADGYYEWKKSGKSKQPFYIRLPDGQPFALAGLWESWRNPQQIEPGEPIQSCTIITTDANRLTQAIHDRMPVILPPDSYALWLDPACQDPQEVQSLLRPCDWQPMLAEPVDPWVNNPRNDAPRCIEVRQDLLA